MKMEIPSFAVPVLIGTGLLARCQHKTFRRFLRGDLVLAKQ